MSAIKDLHLQLETLEAEGHELLISDESLFSPNSYNRSHHWSKAGRPIRRKGKFAS